MLQIRLRRDYMMVLLDWKIINISIVILLKNIKSKDRSLRQLLQEYANPCRSCRRLRSFDLAVSVLQKIFIGKQRRCPTGVQENNRPLIEALAPDAIQQTRHCLAGVYRIEQQPFLTGHELHR